MEKKKNRTGLRVFGGILVGIALCLIAGFVLYNQGYVTINANNAEKDKVKEETKDEEKGKETTTNNNYNNLGFDSSKVTNANGNNYTLTVSSHTSGINISLDSTRTKVTLAINNALVNEAYALGWITNSNNYVYDPHEITFSKKIVDIFFGGIGQDASGDVILFLMEDGTVEYIPLKAALSAGIENLKSYGTLSGLSDVVKFYQANANNSITILAQTKDGTTYDLSTIVNNASNNQ